MNRAFPSEMLHCLSLPSNVAGVEGMEMSLPERQRLGLKWREEQQVLQDQSCFNEINMLSFLPGQVQNLQGLNMDCSPSPCPGPGPRLDELLAQPIKADPGVENGWVDFGMPKSGVTVESTLVNGSVGQVNSCGYGVNYAISRTASCPPLVAAEIKGRNQKLSVPAGRESFKKRKAENSLAMKGGVEEESRSKKSKGCGEEEQSKITEQNRNKNNNNSQSNHNESNANDNDKKKREASGCTSKDNSKASELQKPDYIHVRARRGQATDSHSLAERVRREKISERMKYLQDLVPGCNKIAGKAGMLDEIINYVQSLQRQVEFLSMKLATVVPRLDLSIDDLFAKEVLASCSASMPTMGVSPEMVTPNYLQYNPMQQMNPICGPEFAINPIDIGLRRTISAPVSVPETTIDPSCFNIPSSLPWDADLQHIYPMEFQQGRSTSFPLQTFTDTIEASSLKMEM